jgi:TonB family protein
MQKHKVVNVEVFDDSDAARQPNLRVLTTEARPSDYRIHQHIHGSYHFDMGDEYVLLEPDPRDDQTTTKLSLTEGSSTSCTLKIGPDRCLTAMNHIEYPIEAWRLAESGTVELSVTVAADGRVTAEGVVAPETASEALRDAARESAASWRFERAQSAQILDVTYRFQLVGAPDFLPHDKVEYHLPNEIVITANPPRGPGPTM